MLSAVARRKLLRREEEPRSSSTPSPRDPDVSEKPNGSPRQLQRDEQETKRVEVDEKAEEESR